MKGCVLYRKERNYWYVQWYQGGEKYRINRYKGFLCRDGELAGIKGREMAERLLSLMRSDQHSEYEKQNRSY
jgi:hypothetical protein